MGLIYGYKNKLNNKWYVGQTSMDLKERHRLHLSGAMNKNASDYNCLFHKKIREYGIDNFDLIILENNINKEQLDEKERYWIKEKQSFVKENGYNLTVGGQRRKESEDYWDIRNAFSPKEILEVIKKIKSGVDFITISKEYNVSESLISQINRGRKYAQPNETYPLYQWQHDKLTNEEVIQIIHELRENDCSNAEIARWHNIDEEVVGKINRGKTYRQLGVEYPIRQDPRKIRADKIKKLLLSTKKNNKEIAMIVGCDPSVVSNIKYGKAFFDQKLIYPLSFNENL